MDKMTIIGADGKPRYEVEGTQVRDMRHQHIVPDLTGIEPGTAVFCNDCGELLGFAHSLEEI